MLPWGAKPTCSVNLTSRRSRLKPDSDPCFRKKKKKKKIYFQILTSIDKFGNTNMYIKIHEK